MSLLDGIFGITSIFKDGVELYTRKALDFKGGWDIVDNPETGRTEVNLPEGTGEGGDLEAQAANTITGNATTSTAIPEGNTPNAYNFTQDGTSTKAGFHDVATLADIEPEGSESRTVTLGAADGLYLFTVVLTATDEDSTRYFAAYSLATRRLGGTLTGGELAEPQDVLLNEPAETESAEEIAVEFENSGGNLLVTVTNGVADKELSVTVATSWVLIPFPSAPEGA